ncbi:hypothetical protein KR038_002911, partial [Drosophila bunnanda]
VTKANAKCKDLLGNNAPNDISMGWLCHTPAIYMDMDFITPTDCHNLKQKLAWEWKVPEADDLVKMFNAILALSAIFVIIILFVCKVKRRSVVQKPVEQEDLPETPPGKMRKKFNLKRLMRRNCRIWCVQTEEEARKQELKIRKKVAVHKERSQRKLAQWNKARERNAQRKKEKLERRIKKEYDR